MSGAFPSDTPEREAFWRGVLVASVMFIAAFCVMVSFGAFEGCAA